MHSVQSTHGIHPMLESIVGSNKKIINYNATIYTFENKLQDMEIKPEKVNIYTIHLQSILLLDIIII